MSHLNRNELEALRVLWDLGELKPGEIQDQFSWEIDNGTLRSVLRILMGKGHVARLKSGKAYLYKARRTRKGVLSRMAKSMAQVFSEGSTAGLIAQLIEAEKLSPEEIDKLRKIAEDKPDATGNRSKRRTKR